MPLPNYRKIVLYPIKALIRLDLFVKLKYQSSNLSSTVCIKYSVVTNFMTSLTMPDPQSSDMRHIQ